MMFIVHIVPVLDGRFIPFDMNAETLSKLVDILPDFAVRRGASQELTPIDVPAGASVLLGYTTNLYKGTQQRDKDFPMTSLSLNLQWLVVLTCPPFDPEG